MFEKKSTGRSADDEINVPLLDSIQETARLLGNSSRTRIYELIADGSLVAVKLGRRRLIRHDSTQALVERLTAAAGQ
jgi:excisionase family DNA binding protein